MVMDTDKSCDCPETTSFQSEFVNFNPRNVHALET